MSHKPADPTPHRWDRVSLLVGVAVAGLVALIHWRPTSWVTWSITAGAAACLFMFLRHPAYRFYRLACTCIGAGGGWLAMGAIEFAFDWAPHARGAFNTGGGPWPGVALVAAGVAFGILDYLLNRRPVPPPADDPPQSDAKERRPRDSAMPTQVQGDRSVAIAGDASGNLIITSDRNKAEPRGPTVDQHAHYVAGRDLHLHQAVGPNAGEHAGSGNPAAPNGARASGNATASHLSSDSICAPLSWGARDNTLLRWYFAECVKFDPDLKACAELDETAVRNYFVSSGLACPGPDEQLCFTHAGMLLCARRDRVRRDIVNVHIHFQDNPGPEQENEEYAGSVLYLYKELLNRLSGLFSRTVGTPSKRDAKGGERIFYEYPQVAIVEALVNLLIHRDYSIDDVARIKVYPDRLVFTNPGSCPYDPDQLLTCTDQLDPQYGRNGRLIEAINRARLNQREGRGIIRIREALEQNGSYQPNGRLGLAIEVDRETTRFTLTIYRRLSPSQRPAEYAAGTSPHPSALHQLPSPPPDFTGREAELAQLLDQIDCGGATISGLRGMGGIGKTALALELASRIKNRFPDAQFYLDLKGTTQPLTPAQAMQHVIRAYHPTAKLPDAEEELRALYLSVLDGQQALLLMDNARDAAQVRPLVPPDGCYLLVTSRWRFALSGWHALDLNALPAADARALLLKFAPRIGESADEIARLCGRLPLALRLAGGALATRPELTPTDYIGQLKAGRARLRQLDKYEDATDEDLGVEASFDLSYRLLSAELQRLWPALAVFPADFDAAAAAAVWACDPAEARDRLGDLAAQSLLEWETERNRCRLHYLARIFADSRLAEADRAAAGHRHAERYLSMLRSADELYLQGGENVRKALALFDLERPNIDAGQRWAADRAETDDSAAKLCCDYPDAGASCLDLRQHPRTERVPWLQAALAGARRLNDRRAESDHLGNLGLAYADLGETRRAIEYHEEALAISREIGDRRAEGQDLGGLGLAYADLGETRRAIDYHEQYLAIAREIGDRRSEADALGNLGLACAALGETRRAIEYYEQVLAVAREIGDRRDEGATLGNLGNAYAALGETRRAIEYYEQHLAIACEIGDRREEGNALWNTAVAWDTLNDRAKAIALAVQALTILEQIEDPNAPMIGQTLERWRTDPPSRITK